jgi:hypothetical protein
MKTFSVFTLLTFVTFCAGVAAQGDASKSILLTVMSKDSEPAFKVGDKIVKGPALPDALVGEKRFNRMSAKLTVVFDGKTRLETMFFVTGTASKLGFESINCYVADDYQRTAIELAVGKGNIPLTEILKSTQ